MSVFKSVDDPFGDQDFLGSVAALGFYPRQQLFLTFDNLVVLAVSHQLQVDLGLESPDADLVFASFAYLFGLLVSHPIAFDYVFVL